MEILLPVEVVEVVGLVLMDKKLAATEAEDLEEAATPPCQVLHDPAVHVHLELEEVHLLPVGAVQRQHVPGLGHLQ